MADADVVVIGAGVAGLRCAADVAATYAPPGWHLIQATTLLDRPDADALRDRVQAHLGDLHRCDTSTWTVVSRHRAAAAVLADLAPDRSAA